MMNDDIMKIQVEYYCKKEIEVHIDLNSGRFLNGYIVSFDDIKFTFRDKKIDDDITIFYVNVKNLEPFIKGGKY